MHTAKERIFPSIELLVETLDREFGQTTPLPQYGSAESIRVFKNWYSAIDSETALKHGTVVVPPDPTGFLSFPTLRQDFELARSPDDEEFAPLSLEEIARTFGFEPRQLDQPIYSLSGGERTRAALGKASMLLHRATDLVLCTPTHWLHLDSYSHLDSVLARAGRLRKQAHLFLLDGDQVLERQPLQASVRSGTVPRSVSWFIEGANFEIQLFNNTEPNASDRTIRVDISTLCNIEFHSPTILTGINGAGKSLLAKTLSNTVRSSRPIEAKSKYGCGHSRLVLQDTLSHLFRRSIAQHPARVFEFDQEAKKKVDAIFSTLSTECRKRLWSSKPEDAYLVGPEAEPRTLFQAKLALIAERIVYSPPLLILDEPSWGLSVRQADALIGSVVNYCHEREIPIAMISHLRPNLTSFGNSTIHVTRNGDSISTEVKL